MVKLSLVTAGMFTSYLTVAAVAMIGGEAISDIVTRPYELEVATAYGAPDGYARMHYTINGEMPGPLLSATQGETFVVTVINKLPMTIGMHWHGLHQRGTPEYDGVPGVNQYGIPPGGNFTYRFGTEDNYGAYWYHVHVRGLYQDGLRGPLLIHPAPDVARPYGEITNVSSELAEISAAERGAPVVLVNDWFHDTSEVIMARLAATNDSMMPLCANSILFNGKGRVICPSPTNNTNSFGCESMDTGMSSTGAMKMGMNSRAGLVHDLTGYKRAAMSSRQLKEMLSMSDMQMDGTSSMSTPTMASSMNAASTTAPMKSMEPSVLSSMSSMAVPSTEPMDDMMNSTSGMASMSCQDTNTILFDFAAPGNNSWFMFHLVNAGAAQQLAFSIDKHDLWIVSADGAYVKPVKVQVLDLAIGQRYGILARRPGVGAASYHVRAVTRTHQKYEGRALLTYGMAEDNTVPAADPWMTVDGLLKDNTTVLLSPSTLSPYPPIDMPTAQRQIWLGVNQTEPKVWVIDGVPFGHNNNQVVPLLFAPRDAPAVFRVNSTEVIDLILQIPADSLDDMAHPIHLHGHYFRVLGSLANSTFPANMTIAQVLQDMPDSVIGQALDGSSASPRRDSVHLPEGGWLAIRFLADNPGAWLLHCHINSHLASGMAVVFIEMENQLPVFNSSVVAPPVIAPLTIVPEV